MDTDDPEAALRLLISSATARLEALARSNRLAAEEGRAARTAASLPATPGP